MLNTLWFSLLQVIAVAIFCAFWVLNALVSAAAGFCCWLGKYVDDLLECAF